MKYKKRSASDDSFIADDDDYEKIAQKREIVKHNKNLARTTINDHLKKFTEQETTNSEPVDNEGSLLLSKRPKSKETNIFFWFEKIRTKINQRN